MIVVPLKSATPFTTITASLPTCSVELARIITVAGGVQSPSNTVPNSMIISPGGGVLSDVVEANERLDEALRDAPRVAPRVAARMAVVVTRLVVARGGCVRWKNYK